jgi:hypothetical protein
MKIIAAILLLAAPLSAQTINDSDLGGKGFSILSERRVESEGRREPGAIVFQLKSSASPKASAEKAVTGVLELVDLAGAAHAGRLAQVKLLGTGASDAWIQTTDDGRFSIPLPDGLSGTYRLRVSLDNRYWAYHNPNSDSGYEWETKDFPLSAGAGTDLGSVRPAAGAENAKLAVLHLLYLEALDFLRTNADVDWWTTPLAINWPSNGDFYTPGGWSLDLTDPTHWDVVTHELGHAVQAGMMNIRSAGGEHKIDQCYSPELAWSEGWASFFAIAVHAKLDDADAKFQYMVPRRAPIRVENVPADVCQGEASEWRVTAGLWDLIDTHDDGLDHFSMPFNALWKSLRGQSMGSMTEAWALIKTQIPAGQQRAAEDALIQNTLLPARAPLTVSLPKMAPSFDGSPR